MNIVKPEIFTYGGKTYQLVGNQVYVWLPHQGLSGMDGMDGWGFIGNIFHAITHPLVQAYHAVERPVVHYVGHWITEIGRHPLEAAAVAASLYGGYVWAAAKTAGTAAAVASSAGSVATSSVIPAAVSQNAFYSSLIPGISAPVMSAAAASPSLLSSAGAALASVGHATVGIVGSAGTFLKASEPVLTDATTAVGAFLNMKSSALTAQAGAYGAEQNALAQSANLAAQEQSAQLSAQNAMASPGLSPQFGSPNGTGQQVPVAATGIVGWIEQNKTMVGVGVGVLGLIIMVKQSRMGK